MDLNSEEKIIFLLSASFNALPTSYVKLRSYFKILSCIKELQKADISPTCQLLASSVNCVKLATQLKIPTNFDNVSTFYTCRNLKLIIFHIVANTDNTEILSQEVSLTNIAEKNNLKLPKCFMRKTLICPYCYFPWSEDTSMFNLYRNKKLTKNQKQMIKSGLLEDNTVYSRKLRNRLVLKCKVCCKTSSFSLKKRNEEISNNIEDVKLEVSKKKKKKVKCKLTKSSELQLRNNLTHLKNKNTSVDSAVQANDSKIVCNKSQVLNNSSTKVKAVAVSSNSNSTPKIKPNAKLAINPYALQNKHKLSKKNKKKISNFQQALKEEKESVRNQLKGFLSLIS